MAAVVRPLRVFYIYAHQDEAFLEQIEKHLRLLVRKKQIVTWHDREIFPGMDRENEIDQNLNKANLILLLFSVDFVASDYAYGKEMQRALERHAAGDALVIPIIIRPVDWQGTPFDRLQVLPSGGKPVIIWPRKEEAFENIAFGIRKAINTLLKRQYIITAEIHEADNQYEEALNSYEQALQITPNDFVLHQKKGDILLRLGRLTEALHTYEQAITLAPSDASLHIHKGDTLFALSQFDQALLAYTEANAAFEDATRLKPDFGPAYTSKGKALEALAKQSYERLKQLAEESYRKANKAKKESEQSIDG